MKKLFVLLIALHSSTVTFSQSKFPKDFTIEILGGFGKQHVNIPLKHLQDGTKIDFEQPFLKSFRIGSKARINKKYWAELDFGITYDYNVGYTVNKNGTGQGLSAGLPEAGSEYYTLWHLIANIHRDLWANKKFDLKGFGGIGLQLYKDNNYINTETLTVGYNTGAKYYHLPSYANRKPIIVLDAGMEFHYKITRKSSMLLRPSLQFGTKTFIVDVVRIETQNSSQEIYSSMNGSNALLSFGYSYRF